VLAGICTANGYMAVANTLVSLSWLTLSVVAATSLQVCDDFWQIQKLVVATTALSCLEVVHAAVGLTRSKPGNVILFVGARAFIALYICPLAGCSATYRTTAFTWGLGECIRLGCFAVDAVRPSVTAKTVRYTVGPIMFPIGSLGEWVLLIGAMRDGRPALWAPVIGWPIGFAVLMRQLLAQRRKHLKGLADKSKGL